jgi:hypothetical protein
MAKAPVIDGTWSAEEWKEAEVTRDFVVPVVGKTAEPATRAWIGMDEQKLYLAVCCGLAPGTEPRAAATNRDGNVWEDDSIETFVWPGNQSTSFHQIIINSRGVAFDATHKLDPRTGQRSATGTPGEWNPACEKAVSRIKDGWVLEMAVPLREIGLRPEGVQVIRLNLWRNIVPGGTRYSSWAAMPKIDALQPHAYGFGICSSPAATGQGSAPAEQPDWNYPGVLALEGSMWTIISPQRDDIVLQVNLPDVAFSGTPVVLTPSVTPLLPGGTNGDPVALGKFQVKSSVPMHLVIDGIEPGDYRLTAKLSGGVSPPEVGGILMVRKATVPEKVTGRVLFDDRDWRDANAVAGAAGVETAITPSVLLKTELATPVFLFDPTEDDTITCMTEYKGKLYLGSCTAPAMTDTGSIYIYDPDLHIWKKAFQVNEQGLIRLEVHGDTLYVAGYDANDGGWDLGNIYLYDGVTWTERRTVPRAVHAYGLAIYKGRIHVSADILDDGPPDVPLNRRRIYGRVVSSGDNGLTWREEYRGPTQGQDVGLLAVLKDQLVLNARGDLIIFDGQTWRPLSPSSASFMYVLDYAVDQNRLLLGTPFGLCYYDGERSWRSALFTWGTIRGISRFGDHWVFVSYSLPGTHIGHGPGGTHHYPSLKEADPKTPKFWASLTLVPRETLDRDAAGGADFDRSKMWKEVRSARIPELPTSCGVCQGRLYVGTHPDGRVFVLPVTKEGRLESTPHPIPKAGACRLYWEAATPPGTLIRLQVRSAADKESLAGASYAGPDGTAQTFFEQSGALFKVEQTGFIQYRAVLTTQDPARTPYLKRVTVSGVE